MRVSDRIGEIITRGVFNLATALATIGFVVVYLTYQHTAKRPFDPAPYLFLLTYINIVQMILMPLLGLGDKINDRKLDEIIKRLDSNDTSPRPNRKP